MPRSSPDGLSKNSTTINVVRVITMLMSISIHHPTATTMKAVNTATSPSRIALCRNPTTCSDIGDTMEIMVRPMSPYALYAGATSR